MFVARGISGFNPEKKTGRVVFQSSTNVAPRFLLWIKTAPASGPACLCIIALLSSSCAPFGSICVLIPSSTGGNNFCRFTAPSPKSP